METTNASINLPRGIYVSSKPVKYSEYGRNSYKNAQHLILIYSDGNGNHRIIRAGPEDNNIFTNSLPGGSRIELQIDIPFEKSHDLFEESSGPETRHYQKLNINDDDIDNLWNKFKRTAEKIEYANLQYNLPIRNNGGIIQNSNSTMPEKNTLSFWMRCFLMLRILPAAVLAEIAS